MKKRRSNVGTSIRCTDFNNFIQKKSSMTIMVIHLLGTMKERGKSAMFARLNHAFAKHHWINLHLTVTVTNLFVIIG